ncbi:MAG: c-type cytochrome [Chitinophagaceae bacterium]
MRYITILLAGFAFLIACNTSCNVNDNVQGPDNLETTQYVISTDRDTILQTKNGAFLKIPKGTLTSDNGSTATFDIKEAYSISQMIQGGLTTASNGAPLSSGGMIYINAAKGQNITINQKIQVAIPADFLQKGMQLYKGEEGKDGKINWADPSPLDDNSATDAIDDGKILFQRSCASCHNIGRNMTGPDLAHFMKRFPPTKQNFKYYKPHSVYFNTTAVVEMPADTIRTLPDNPGIDDTGDYTDLYMCNLKNMFGSIGPAFPDFSKKQLLSIYRYIQNESDRLNLPMPGHTYLKDCVDSCKLYNKKTKGLTAKKIKAQNKRDHLEEENGLMVDNKADSTWISSLFKPNTDSVIFYHNDLVVPEKYNASYYKFSIKSFGWTNIDMRVTEIDNVLESELSVKVSGEYKNKVEVFLIIPSVKVYGEGGPTDDDQDKYFFFYKTGKIVLPQNVPAYILALSEKSESFAYGLVPFTTSASQHLNIELHASSKQEFTDAMKQFDLDRLHITVDDAKNANKIRRTDRKLEKIDQQLEEAEALKPKGCNCSCGDYNTTDSLMAVK